MRGSATILQYLYDNLAGRPLSDMFTVFGTLVYVESVFDGFQDFIPAGSPATFGQCYKYVEALCRTCTPSFAWLSPTLEAPHWYVGRLLGASFYYIVYDAVRPEDKSREALRSDCVKKKIAELEDPQFQQAMREVKQLVISPLARPNTVDQLVYSYSVASC